MTSAPLKRSSFIILVTAFSLPGMGFDEKITWVYAVGLPIVIFLIANGAKNRIQAMKKSLSLTTANKINKFAKERQDR